MTVANKCNFRDQKRTIIGGLFALVVLLFISFYIGKHVGDKLKINVYSYDDLISDSSVFQTFSKEYQKEIEAINKSYETKLKAYKKRYSNVQLQKKVEALLKKLGEKRSEADVKFSLKMLQFFVEAMYAVDAIHDKTGADITILAKKDRNDFFGEFDLAKDKNPNNIAYIMPQYVRISDRMQLIGYKNLSEVVDLIDEAAVVSVNAVDDKTVKEELSEIKKSMDQRRN